jgi:hypothetical protein
MCLPTTSNRYYMPLAVPAAGLAALGAEMLSPTPFRPNAGRPETGPIWDLWSNYKPGVLFTLAGLLYWAIWAGFGQPTKAGGQSERPVAVAFAPHLAPGEKVYIDTFDRGAPLFYYLNHPGGRWFLEGSPIADRFAVVLDEFFQQESLLMKRKDEKRDVKVEILERAQTRGGDRWLLVRVSKGPPRTSQPDSPKDAPRE